MYAYICGESVKGQPLYKSQYTQVGGNSCDAKVKVKPYSINKTICRSGAIQFS